MGVTAENPVPADPAPGVTQHRYLPNTREEELAFKWLLHFHSVRAILVCAYYVQKEKEFQKSRISRPGFDPERDVGMIDP